MWLQPAERKNLVDLCDRLHISSGSGMAFRIGKILRAKLHFVSLRALRDFAITVDEKILPYLKALVYKPERSGQL